MNSCFALAVMQQGREITTIKGLAKSGNPPEEKTHSSHGFGAVFSKVRVALDLGEIRVARIGSAYDAGRVVTPKLADSQVIGDIVGRIGTALLKEAEWDEKLGRAVNANLAEYLVPVNADVRSLDVLFVGRPDTVTNLLGVNGVAELGRCGIVPAIANAIWYATGKRMGDLLITPDKLLIA